MYNINTGIAKVVRTNISVGHSQVSLTMLILFVGDNAETPQILIDEIPSGSLAPSHYDELY